MADNHNNDVTNNKAFTHDNMTITLDTEQSHTHVTLPGVPME